MKKAIVFTSLAVAAVGAGAVGWYLWKNEELPEWISRHIDKHFGHPAEPEKPIPSSPLPGPTEAPSAQSPIVEDVKEEEKQTEDAAIHDPQIVTISGETDPNDLQGLEARIAQIKEHIKKAEETGDQMGQTELGYILAVSYLGGGMIQEALDQYERALVRAHDTEHKSMEAACLIDLGSLKLQLGDFEGSIKCFEKGFVVGKDFTQPEAQSNARFQLGFAYVGAGRSQEAIEVFKQVEAQLNPDEVTEESTTLHQALGSELLKAGEPAKAIPHLKVALDTLKKLASDSNDTNIVEIIADVLFFLGSAHFALSQFGEARNTLDELLPLLQEGGGRGRTSLISQLLLYARLSLCCSFTNDQTAAKLHLSEYDRIVGDIPQVDADTDDEVAMREAKIIADLGRGFSDGDVKEYLKAELLNCSEDDEGEAKKQVLGTLATAMT